MGETIVPWCKSLWQMQLMLAVPQLRGWRAPDLNRGRRSWRGTWSSKNLIWCLLPISKDQEDSPLTNRPIPLLIRVLTNNSYSNSLPCTTAQLQASTKPLMPLQVKSLAIQSIGLPHRQTQASLKPRTTFSALQQGISQSNCLPRAVALHPPSINSNLQLPLKRSL